MASAEYVYGRILALREQGAGILLLSSHLDEVLGLADRIMVLYHGRVVGELPNAPKLDKTLVGEYMLGVRDDFHKGGEIAEQE